MLSWFHLFTENLKLFLLATLSMKFARSEYKNSSSYPQTARMFVSVCLSVWLSLSLSSPLPPSLSFTRSAGLAISIYLCLSLSLSLNTSCGYKCHPEHFSKSGSQDNTKSGPPVTDFHIRRRECKTITPIIIPPEPFETLLTSERARVCHTADVAS